MKTQFFAAAALAVLLSGCAAPGNDSAQGFHNFMTALSAGAIAGSMYQPPPQVIYRAPPQQTRCRRVFNEVHCTSY